VMDVMSSNREPVTNSSIRSQSSSISKSWSSRSLLMAT